MTYDQALNRIAEVTKDNRDDIRRSRLQRRTEFTDLYGIPFTAQGDAKTPARFYISISPDLVYFLRFQFKLQIQGMQSTVDGVSGEISSVGDTSLASDVYANLVNNTSTGVIVDDGITPNPHTHDAGGGLDSITYGIHKIATDSENFSIKIHGVDITEYLIEQQDGEWIYGEGIYPTNGDLSDDEDFYDVLAVASLMHNEGETEKVSKLLKPEFKEVEISSDKPFMATMYLYMKYSVSGR